MHQVCAPAALFAEVFGDPVSHLAPEGGQVELGQPPVENLVRIEDFTVAHEVYGGTGHASQFRRVGASR